MYHLCGHMPKELTCMEVIVAEYLTPESSQAFETKLEMKTRRVSTDSSACGASSGPAIWRSA
jgi:hypothetical protein